jgi:hypothetical protein
LATVLPLGYYGLSQVHRDIPIADRPHTSRLCVLGPIGALGVTRTLGVFGFGFDRHADARSNE